MAADTSHPSSSVMIALAWVRSCSMFVASIWDEALRSCLACCGNPDANTHHPLIRWQLANWCISAKNSSVSPGHCVTNWSNVLNMSVAYTVMRACLICSVSALYLAFCTWQEHHLVVIMGECAWLCPWCRVHRRTLHSRSIQQWAYSSLHHWILGLAGNQRPFHPSCICWNSLKNEERKKKKTLKTNRATPERVRLAICDWNSVTCWTLLWVTPYPIVFHIIHWRHRLW